jgi:hypothetical protein
MMEIVGVGRRSRRGCWRDMRLETQGYRLMMVGCRLLGLRQVVLRLAGLCGVGCCVGGPRGVV